MADMSERELWLRLVEALTHMRECARGLALHRSDQRWLAIASIADQTRDSAEKLFQKSRRQGSHPLVTPAGKPLVLPKTPGGH